MPFQQGTTTIHDIDSKYNMYQIVVVSYNAHKFSIILYSCTYFDNSIDGLR